MSVRFAHQCNESLTLGAKIAPSPPLGRGRGQGESSSDSEERGNLATAYGRSDGRAAKSRNDIGECLTKQLEERYNLVHGYVNFQINNQRRMPPRLGAETFFT